MASIIVLLLAGCSATVTPPPSVFLTAAGSTSLVPLMETLATAYSVRRPHVNFDIQGGGSQLGQQLVGEEQVEIGLVSWPPPDLAEGLRLVPVAQDAIAIVSHADNRHPGLSLVELREIFRGGLLDWRAVDGPALPIQVVSREDGSGTRAAFEAMVMADQPVTPAAIVLPNSRAVVDYVAQNPNAIGYVSRQLVNDQVHTIPIEGVNPSLETITAQSYPLRRELALIVPESGRPAIEDFVEFALSPTGQAIIGERWGRVR